METKSSNKKSSKSLEDFAIEAKIAINSYRRALFFEFFKLDPDDLDYDSLKVLYSELDDLYGGIVHYLDENPNPFDNVL